MAEHPKSLADAGDPAATALFEPSWQVLAVDQDYDVHRAARAALQGQSLFGRRLALLHARSADEARSLLLRERGVAVVLLDAGMAGGGAEDLPDFIRNAAGLSNTRIVLIAGDDEPAPELARLVQYDISGNLAKSGLDPARLLAKTATAIRSFQSLCALLHNQGLLKRLRDHAYNDPLVRLPNRAHFVEQVDECARRGTRGHILALVDIDDFSAANEMMGHRFGDCLLEMVAQRLVEALPADVLLARVGGDTFGVLGPAERVDPRRLLECMRQPLTIEGIPYKVSLTCGYVLLSGDRQAGAELVKDATITLKRAKRDHRGQYLQYLDHMGTEARARAQLLSDLRAAIDDGLLFLVYQPQIDLRSGALTGLEALLRWRTRQGRFVPPDQFIPMAEQSGLIVALGRWVLSTACRTMRALLDAGCAPQRMAVNVSMVQLRDPGFFATVCTALSDSGLQGLHLELEITESVAVLPTQTLEATLSALRAEGISIAIDDFGTGYSSLSCLERLPLDRIKIDRSFVRQLGDTHGARIAEMVAQLGRKLGLQVLAEGIEDAATWQTLLAIGCHQGQGFHIARPMDEVALVEWLSSYSLVVEGPVGS